MSDVFHYILNDIKIYGEISYVIAWILKII